MQERLIFHVDVNSAFLSWEAVKRVQNGEADLRLIPSCIGGDPRKRTGIVLAKSLPAKKYGVTTGEPMAMALRKCPMLVSAKPDFRLYDRCSRAFKRICREYAPAMESFSIDEVFLDMTGTGRIYPDPVATATEIKDRIREELGFTVNVGIGPNKLCAKMASDFEKPDKVHTLFGEEIPLKMWPLPVGALFTVGKASALRLEQAGITTIGKLARADLADIQKIVGGKFGTQIHEYANGIDDSPVQDIPEAAKGYSTETTVEEDLEDLESINRMLLAQADVVAARMRKDGVKCCCVAITYRTLDFKNRSHQRKMKEASDSTTEIYELAKRLFRESWNGQPLRLIGLALTELDRGEYEQLSLFTDEKKERMKRLDFAIDSIRSKYGNESVQRASILEVERRVGRKHKAKMAPGQTRSDRK